MDETNAIQVYDNPQPRCACVLLLDTSGSMEGRPIQELNRGLRHFMECLMQDDFARFSVEPCIVTFGGETDIALPFTSLARASGELECLPVLAAQGGTPMGTAIRTGLHLLDDRKAQYRRDGIPYYQPWMVLMSDGQPTDEVQSVVGEIHGLCNNRKLVFLGIGIGEQADMAALSAICPSNRPPKKLEGLRFSEFFEWLSQSASQVSRSSVGDQVLLPPTDGWASI